MLVTLLMLSLPSPSPSLALALASQALVRARPFSPLPLGPRPTQNVVVVVAEELAGEEQEAEEL